MTKFPCQNRHSARRAETREEWHFEMNDTSIRGNVTNVLPRCSLFMSKTQHFLSIATSVGGVMSGTDSSFDKIINQIPPSLISLMSFGKGFLTSGSSQDIVKIQITTTTPTIPKIVTYSLVVMGMRSVTPDGGYITVSGV